MVALPEKGEGGLGQFADLRGTWRKRGCFFGEGGGGDSPMYTMRV